MLVLSETMGIGVDIGGSYTDVVEFRNGKFTHVKTIETAEALSNPDQIEYENAVYGVAAWIRNGRIVKAPNLKGNLDFLKGKRIENDANCFAAYSKFVTKKRNIFAVTLGTGVGSGVIIDGKLYRGRGLAAELGHVYVGGNVICSCGGRGHLECYFSGWRVKQIFGREANKNELKRVEGFEVLCREIAKAVMILDPEVVTIGGRLGRVFNEEDFKKIYEYLPEEFDVEVKIIDDDLAVAKGAALISEGLV